MLKGDDCILCQITSSRYDEYSISVSDDDIAGGKLRRKSMIRPNMIFTADRELIRYRIGALKKQKLDSFIRSLVNIFRS